MDGATSTAPHESAVTAGIAVHELQNRAWRTRAWRTRRAAAYTHLAERLPPVGPCLRRKTLHRRHGMTQIRTPSPPGVQIQRFDSLDAAGRFHVLLEEMVGVRTSSGSETVEP